MLEEMRIRDLGVITDATLELGPGLVVLTGETGAGKTMVLTGLHLLCGGRADPGRVRSGASRATVEGRLRVVPDGRAMGLLAEAGAELDDDGSLLVARTVAADGRSRAYLGGRSVPGSVLAAVMAELVAVHGQSSQVGLLRPAAQREALDRLAGVADRHGGADELSLLEEYRAEFRAWRAAGEDLRRRTGEARERAREAELLRHGLAEVASVDPQPGEDEALAAEAAVLSHVDALRAAAAAARSAFAQDAEDAGGPGADVLSLVVAARRALGAVSGHDPVLDELGSRAAEVAALAGDLAADLAAYEDRLDSDPGRLAWVEERRATLGGLTRRYGDTVTEVLAWADDARRRLADLDDSEETLAALRQRRDRHADRAAELATALRRARERAAAHLGAAVTGELAGLAMRGAAVTVAVRPNGAGSAGDHGDADGGPEALVVDGAPCQAGSDGCDTVELLLAPHVGATARPLAKVASGGELSRVMLAIEVVLAAVTGTPTMVFDEVDAGVGGSAAVEVGRRLAQLAQHHQVLVVTHLAQVAAFATSHLAVTKGGGATVTVSDVRVLLPAARSAELARMLGGIADSGSAQEHARELLAMAAAGGSGPVDGEGTADA